MPEFKCCNLSFECTKSYIKHLRQHKNKKDLFITCNICSHTSGGWDAFKRHYHLKHSVDINKVTEPEPEEPMAIDGPNNAIHEVDHYITMFTNDLDNSNLNSENGIILIKLSL